MPVRFGYVVKGSGWATATLTIGDNTIAMSASYLSDALDDLLRAVTSVVKGAPDAVFDFVEEPGVHRWHIDRLSEAEVRVRIFALPRMFASPDQPGELVFDARCRLRTFAGAVLSAAQKVELSPGYKAAWKVHDLPAGQIRALEDALREARAAAAH